MTIKRYTKTIPETKYNLSPVLQHPVYYDITYNNEKQNDEDGDI